MCSLVVCDPKYVIRKIFGLYPGSVSDHSLLAYYNIPREFKKLHPYFSIGDGGFVSRRWLVVPYRGINFISGWILI